MEKYVEIQRQVRDNAKTLNTYMTDLQNWEATMKRKEAALSGEFEQMIPPVRSKTKKEKPVQVKKKPEPRISASDYLSWEKFDVDKACEDIDMKDMGPSSLDSKKSQSAKMEKLRDEALHEKERGNTFVKQGKWDEAISCYNRAIELVKDDAIYFANRGLCHLKKESLHLAESDCTEALRLDPTYVKALQRRATARERLGSLRAACNDLVEVVKLEPKNKAAVTQLEQIRARMGTKGAKPKSSPTSPAESKPSLKAKATPKIIELEDPKPPKEEIDNWLNGVGENVTVLRPVKKPPHLRSKRPLKRVPILEIPLGKSPNEYQIINFDLDSKATTKGEGDVSSPESEKLVESSEKVREGAKAGASTDALLERIGGRAARLAAPTNSVQFMQEWKALSGAHAARSIYFSIIDPSKIPSIFDNALESDVLSDFLRSMYDDTDKFSRYGVMAYLTALTRVKRFSALTMFLSATDKQVVNALLDECKNDKNSEEIADLKKKYEL